MKVSILDSGKFSRPENWVETEGGTFKLFIDGNYIAAVELSEIGMIVVSTLHKVELRKD